MVCTPKMYPTSAEVPMARVPQIQMRRTAFKIFEPPAFAANTPDNAKKSMENPYW